VVIVLVVATIGIALTLERPNGEVSRSTWAYEMVQLERARELGWTGGNVRVGIIDTGIDMDHPTMEDVDLVAWKDLVRDRDQPYDDQGHGTAMASIITGGSPLRGGAPDVELIVAKVMDEDTPFDDRTIADGIDFCLDPDGENATADSAHIISLSLGGDYESIDLIVGPATQAAIAQAVSMGVVVVAAAGNDPETDDVMFPGRFPDVVSVGAVDRRGQVAPFSTPGNDSVERPDPDKKPEVVAPGVDIVTAHVDGLYAQGSGTSHATAMVTTVLAVALSHNRDMLLGGERGGNVSTVRAIKTALMETVEPLDGQVLPHDPRAGYGMVQAVDLGIRLEV
jgi:subtilisin family serine protease